MTLTGLVGHSYLVHSLSSTNQTVDQEFYIQFTFKTSHSEGILFYTGKQGQMFLTSYIQDGVLQFKVYYSLVADLAKFSLISLHQR